jgi:hypothetical protein
VLLQHLERLEQLSKVGVLPAGSLMRLAASSYSAARRSVMYSAAALNTSTRDLKWCVIAPRDMLAFCAIFSVVVWV